MLKKKMFFKNCLLYILAVFIIQTKCDENKPQGPTHDQTVIDSSITETGVCYFFAYDNVVDSAKNAISSDAEVYGEAYFPGYTLGFARIGEKPEEVSATLVKKDGGKALGLVYSVPIKDYEKYRDYFAVDFDDGNQISRSIAITVKLQKEGKEISVQCNTIVTVAAPTDNDKDRPIREYLQEIVDSLRCAGIDSNYVENVASIPTQCTVN